MRDEIMRWQGTMMGLSSSLLLPEGPIILITATWRAYHPLYCYLRGLTSSLLLPDGPIIFIIATWGAYHLHYCYLRGLSSSFLLPEIILIIAIWRAYHLHYCYLSSSATWWAYYRYLLGPRDNLIFSNFVSKNLKFYQPSLSLVNAHTMVKMLCLEKTAELQMTEWKSMVLLSSSFQSSIAALQWRIF